MIVANEILLFDVIVAADEYSEGSAATFARELRELHGQRREVVVRINSPGGSLFEGLAVVDAIRQAQSLGRRVATVVDGCAFSIASAIACAGKPVVMGSAAVLMIHDPWSPFAGGTVADLQRTIRALEAGRKSLVDIYHSKSGQSRKTIEGWLADETWFTPAEVLAAGLVDEISSAMPRLAALCDTAGYSVPEHVMAELHAPARQLVHRVLRETREARETSDSDLSIAACYRAADAGERLLATPGATASDLAVVARALAEANEQQRDAGYWAWRLNGIC